MSEEKLGPAIERNRSELEKRHYVLSPTRKDYWVDLRTNPIKEIYDEFGNDFYLIIFNPSSDAFVIPFSKLKHIWEDKYSKGGAKIPAKIVKNKMRIPGFDHIDVSQDRNNADPISDILEQNGEETSQTDRFQWVSFFKELAEKLLKFRDRQEELLDIISEANPDRQPIEVIDPFTFFAYINKIRDFENRSQYLKSISNQIPLESPIPEDFLGVPTAIGTNLRYFNSSEDIDNLWDFAEQVIHSPREKIRADLFSQCLGITNVAISKLTQGMFWLAPDKFLPFDNKTRAYLSGSGIRPDIIESLHRDKEYSDYLNLLAEVDEKLQQPYYVISHKAHLESVKKDNTFKFEAPFDRMFNSLEEADRAFNLLRRGVEILGLGPDDEGDRRIACTLQARGKKCILRVNFVFWAVLAIIRDSEGKLLFEFACRDDLVPDDNVREIGDGFADTIDEHLYHLSQIPIETAENDQSAFDQSLRAIKEHFAHHKATRWRQYHRPEVFHAFFDENARRSLLKNGMEPKERSPNPPYTLSELAADVYMPTELIARWKRALLRKKQAIFYGPPGTGKTFVAQLLTKHLIAGGDGFAEVLQFHPSYAYEDFMQGLRPKALKDGGLEYAMEPGRFKNFCMKAGECEGDCVLVIDEINRANLARVFGELMYLLEYRSQSTHLSGGEQFRIPNNVLIIGTMNTADRSIALVDHALRRRFAFLALYPDYDILRKYYVDLGFIPENLIEVLDRLNKTIGDPHYWIGVSYFLAPDIESKISDIWQMEIEPYIEELFFDQPDKAKRFAWDEVGEDILGR